MIFLIFQREKPVSAVKSGDGPNTVQCELLRAQGNDGILFGGTP